MKFVNLTKKEYETLLSNTSPTNFYQDLSWLEFQSNLGHTCHILGIKDNNKIIAATMLLSRNEFVGKKEFYAIRGFLIDYNNYELLKFFTTCIKKYIRKNNGFILRIDPYIMKQQRDICTIIISHLIPLVRQSHPEVQEDVRLDMEH